MELFGEEIINSICDLNDEKEEVQDLLQTYVKILDEVMDEMKRTHQESSLYFGNTDELKQYLVYLLKSRHQRDKFYLEEAKLRIIKCDCGCIWKIFVEPHTPEHVSGYWFDRHHADREPENYPMESVMERALYFRCSICERVSLVRSATKIYRIESEKIPPHALRKY